MSLNCCVKVTANHCRGGLEGFLNKKAVEWCEKEHSSLQLLTLKPQSFLRYWILYDQKKKSEGPDCGIHHLRLEDWARRTSCIYDMDSEVNRSLKRVFSTQNCTQWPIRLWQGDTGLQSNHLHCFSDVACQGKANHTLWLWILFSVGLSRL